MGQNAWSCRNNSTAKDFMSHEIKIYKWRSDPNCNTHLPKVTFKDALSYKQQEAYIQFMMLNSQKDAIEIQRLRAEMELIPDISNQQVVIFQKYVGSLENIKQQLILQEALYCLAELLFGFEEIKKMYKDIIVKRNCCFVTRNGQIRAWISPNPKSNKIESDNLLAQRQYKEIISSILDITFESSLKTPIICNFFQMIRTKLKQIVKRNELFSFVRSIIQEYRIAHSLHYKTFKEYSLRIEAQNQLAIRSTQQQISHPQQHIFTLINDPQFPKTQRKLSFMQSKAVQSHNSTEISYMRKTSFPNFQPSTYIHSKNLQEYHQVAHYPPYESLLCKYLNKRPSEGSGQTTVRLSQALKKSEKPIKSINIKRSIPRAMSIAAQEPNKLLSSESFNISISNFSNKEEIQSTVIKMGQINHKNSLQLKKGYKSQNKETPSLVKHVDTIKESQRALVETKKQESLKPCSSMRCGSIRSVNSSSEANRPWMTSKTINKLITESPNGSVLQSIGTSQSQVSQLQSAVLVCVANDCNGRKVSSTSINES